MSNRVITDLCQECRNYFPVKVLSGTWVISDHKINCEEIGDGQYFLIDGSIYNDEELHLTDDYLIDEVFEGDITLCAIPKSFEDFAVRVEEWRNQYESIESENMSPFTSESFSGYSYSKNVGETNSWTNAFKQELRRWKKI